MGKNLQIISEPEAAAIYALHAMDPHSIQVSDTFVLCDAGGGTVDLISYTVTELKPILKVTEAAMGSGRLCGSTFLNRIFQKYLVEKLGLNEEWDDEVVEDAMKRFDLVTKKAFRGGANEEFVIPGESSYKVAKSHWTVSSHYPVPGLADDPSQGVRRGKFKMTGTEVKKIFDPVVDEVVALVRGQIAATNKQVKAVLMVGGFGQNAYLRETVRAAIDSKIEVMQPPNGWTAVVRGALMKGLSQLEPDTERVKVASRTARKHYGTEIMSKYDSSKHAKSTSWLWVHPSPSSPSKDLAVSIATDANDVVQRRLRWRAQSLRHELVHHQRKSRDRRPRLHPQVPQGVEGIRRPPPNGRARHPHVCGPGREGRADI